jgi:predicted nucleotidyltransferase component of viral defense system
MASRDYHEDVDLFRDAVSFTQSETGFSGRLIEKDYYCSVVLEDLSLALVRELVFKGGTSLSKVHGGFYRLSEDLDFAISTPVDASRSERSKRIASLKAHLANLPKRVSCLQVVAALRGYNNSTQYIGQFCYRSLLTGEDESIKVEVSVREPIVEAVRELPARTLLLDPFHRNPVIDSIQVAVLSRQEAYAEKLRAALSRREPAIRDFYDVDRAVRAGWIDPTNPALVELVGQKLAVPGNDGVDVSEEKLRNLRKQVENRLKPVLRESDFADFNLDRAFDAVCRFAEPLL